MDQFNLQDLLNYGNAAFMSGDFKKAIKWYQSILTKNPAQLEAHINLGLTLKKQGQFSKAKSQFEIALKINPNLPAIHYNLGNLYLEQKEYFPAIDCFTKALRLQPNFPQATQNLKIGYSECCIHYFQTKRPIQALEIYKLALKAIPDFNAPTLVVNLYPTARSVCDWPMVRLFEQQLAQLPNLETPYGCLLRTDNKVTNYRVAHFHSQKLTSQITKPFLHQARGTNHRGLLRIAYLSPDFTTHVVGQDIKDVFKYHDRTQFEIFAYALNPPDTSPVYRFIQKHADHFCNVHTIPSATIAKQIHDDHIDILVDLCGYTKNNRLDILAHKPAPIQVNYLGMPGTTGADFMDYIFTDSVLTPLTDAAYYSEKLVHLPHGYHFSSYISLKTLTQRAIPPRANFNLPEKAIVFCSFNIADKINQEIMTAWFSILKQVPQSVLWLLEPLPEARQRIIALAHNQNIDPKRLIFAPKVDNQTHLTRLRQADIALDTITCNGSTTTSDALFAGIPIITMVGHHYLTRMTMSFLTHLNLPELIAPDQKTYENRAVQLATHPDKLSGLKQRLITSVAHSPLFDSQLMTKDLEQAYHSIWNRYRQSLPPDHITHP